MFESERCEECGGSNYTYSTEWKKDHWIWKKICKSCEAVVEKEEVDWKR